MRLAYVVIALLFTLNAGAFPDWSRFSGTLRGQTDIAGFSSVEWIVTGEPFDEGRHRTMLQLAGEGLTLRASLVTDIRSGQTTWTIDKGSVQLASWASAVAQRWAPEWGHLAAHGELSLSGAGSWENERPHGRIHISTTGASLTDSLAGWTLDGIAFAGNFDLRPDFSLQSHDPAALTVQTISTARFGARQLRVRGRLVNSEVFSVETVFVEIAGGFIESRETFPITLSPFSLRAPLRISRIGVQDVAALVPSGLADARGRLHGEIILGWDKARGVEIGMGNLLLDAFEPTIVRLSPSPGLLTSSIPARFQFLPGKIGRWLSLRNSGYDDLQAIELGHTELRVDSLRIALTPEGDGEGRSARVSIEATPLDAGGAVQKVSFSVNVSGPLSALLNIGLTQDFSTSIH